MYMYLLTTSTSTCTNIIANTKIVFIVSSFISGGVDFSIHRTDNK